MIKVTFKEPQMIVDFFDVGEKNNLITVYSECLFVFFNTKIIYFEDNGFRIFSENRLSFYDNSIVKSIEHVKPTDL